MPEASRKFLLGLLLLFVAGGLIGWFYDAPATGILAAALIALFWQVRHLLAFVRATRTRDFEVFRHGDGIWQQIFSSFASQQARVERSEQEYRELLREISRTTDAMPDAAVILDKNNDIVMSNRAAKMLAGLKPKKDRGQRVDNILRDPKLTKLLRSGDFTRDIEIPSPVRDDGWLNCRVAPYGTEQKLLILRDVTERIRLTRMRRDFVANASHELRSPLTVIAGYLDSLADDPGMPRDWAVPVTQMQIQARRMNRIVAELLELSRLESAGPAVERDLIDVVGLLNAAQRTFYKPGETAVIEVLAESKVRLRGSSNEIESLVTNLLTNAVRHTPADGRITLSWRSDASGAELAVADTGEGIDAEHLPRVTERFFRVDRGRSRDDGGVGLGLAIVKHVLGRHDGRLEIESERGKGSTFTCWFPSSRVVIRPPIPLSGEPQKA
jgi:two-component system phosphate regulon sensor histidine kinase PhoR